MNAKEVGAKVVEMYNGGQIDAIMAELYSDQIKSVEADGKTANGMDELKKKYEWYESNFEVHDTKAKGPFPHGDDHFALLIWMDTTHKESGQRSEMEEVAVYRVDSGKIVEEQFFYSE